MFSTTSFSDSDVLIRISVTNPRGGGGGGGVGGGGGGSIAFSHMLSSVAPEDPPTILWSPRLLGSLISDMKMSLHLVQKQVKLHLKTEASG